MRIFVPVVLLLASALSAEHALAAPTPQAQMRAEMDRFGRTATVRRAATRGGPRLQRGLNMDASARYLHQFEADGDAGTTVSADRFRFTALGVFVGDAGVKVPFGLGARFDHYDMDGTGPFTDAWTDIYTAEINAPFVVPFAQRWRFVGIPIVRGSAEQGADLTDGISLGVLATATYRISDRFRIGPGIGIFRQLEEGVTAVPLLAFDWDIGPGWTLSLLGDRVGAGLSLVYRPSRLWFATLRADVDTLRFRRSGGGVGQDEAVEVVAGLSYTPRDDLRFDIRAGVRIFGTLRMEDARGNFLREEEYDPVPILSVQIRLGGVRRCD